MEIVKKFVIRRADGAYVDIKFERVKTIRQAARFSTIEEYDKFMNGYYRPADPDKYYPQAITVTYEEDRDE